MDGEGNSQPKVVKKKRVRKAVSTITKNKDSLNARPNTISMPDPIFSKLNSIMGDMSSPKRLLLKLLVPGKIYSKTNHERNVLG